MFEYRDDDDPDEVMWNFIWLAIQDRKHFSFSLVFTDLKIWWLLCRLLSIAGIWQEIKVLINFCNRLVQRRLWWRDVPQRDWYIDILQNVTAYYLLLTVIVNVHCDRLLAVIQLNILHILLIWRFLYLRYMAIFYHCLPSWFLHPHRWMLLQLMRFFSWKNGNKFYRMWHFVNVTCAIYSEHFTFDHKQHSTNVGCNAMSIWWIHFSSEKRREFHFLIQSILET